jgi:hypothetical protein
MAWWKSACSGGQHRHRCGYLVDSQKNLKSPPANPCATGVPGSRNTSLPETGTTPGATPQRRKNRETGTSRGYPVPAAGRLTNRPPGNQRASGQRPGQAPASHTCRGLAHSRARPFRPTGLAHPLPDLFPGATGQVWAVGHAAEPFLLFGAVSCHAAEPLLLFGAVSPDCRRRYAIHGVGDVQQLLSPAHSTWAEDLGVPEPGNGLALIEPQLAWADQLDGALSGRDHLHMIDGNPPGPAGRCNGTPGPFGRCHSAQLSRRPAQRDPSTKH